MNRLTICLMLLLILLTLPFSIAAEEPFDPYTLLKQATPAPAAYGKLERVFSGMTSVQMTKFGNAKGFEIIAGTLIGFKLEDLIIPFFGGKKEEISTPDFEPHAAFHEAVAPYTLAQQSIDRLIHWDPVNENIMTARFCAVQTNKSKTGGSLREDIESTGNQESSNIEYSQPLFENARLLNTAWGRQFIMQDTEGKLNMNMPTEILVPSSVLGFCGYNFLSKEKEPIKNDVRKLSSFSGGGKPVEFTVKQTIIDFIETICNRFDICEEIIHYAKDKAAFAVRLYEVAHDGNLHQLANISDATPKEVEKAKNDWTHMLAITRGWTFAFLPEARAEIKKQHAGGTTYSYGVTGRDSDDGGNVFEGGQGEVQHAWPLVSNMEDRLNEALCSVTPDSLQANTSYGSQKNPKKRKKLECELDTKPENSGWNCNANAPKIASEQLSAAGKNWADNAIYTDACKTENAWELCHNDVIDRAKKACVDPLFALTIWLHETGASNYSCGEQLSGGVPVEDFGIHTGSAPPEDFSAQLDTFLKLDYSCPHTMNDWWSMFWLGNGCFASVPDSPVNPESGLTPKQEVEQDVGELQEIYTALGGGTLPNWPKGQCSN